MEPKEGWPSHSFLICRLDDSLNRDAQPAFADVFESGGCCHRGTEPSLRAELSVISAIVGLQSRFDGVWDVGRPRALAPTPTQAGKKVKRSGGPQEVMGYCGSA